MAYDAYTENLADFGMREIEELRDILTAWLDNGLPDDFYDEGVKPAFNRSSGYVFLTNDEMQVCMEVDGKLESFYTSPYYGTEGFYEELLDDADSWDADNADEDLEWLRDIAESRGDTEGVEKLNALIDAFNANKESVESSSRLSGRKITASYGGWNKFYGLPDVEFTVPNDTDDPTIFYNGKYYNYYYLEDALWSEFKEYCDETGVICDEDGFEQWITEDPETVYGWLAEIPAKSEPGRGVSRPESGKLRGSVKSSKRVFKKSPVTAAMSDNPDDYKEVEQILKAYEGAKKNPKTGWTGTVTIKRNDSKAKEWSNDTDGTAWLWDVICNGDAGSSSSTDLIVYYPATMDGGQKFVIYPESGGITHAKNLAEFKKALRSEYSYLR